MQSFIAKSFLLEILQGVHTPQDVYRIALYTALNPATEKYTTAGEVQGQGYGAGGLTLTGYTVQMCEDDACLQWASPVWPRSTIAASCALIYNYSKQNRAVAVLDLGQRFVSTNGDFTIELPEGLIGIRPY